MFLNWLRPLFAGVLHSFEPDHIAAVSVLASESAVRGMRMNWLTVLKSCKWAMGHSLVLLFLGGITLIFKSTLEVFVTALSLWAEHAVGPIMIWLGVAAIRRNHQMKSMMQLHKKIRPHEHDLQDSIHLHGFNGEEIAMNPTNRSFWVGVLHGLAGTGGALTSALVLSAPTYQHAIMILLVESLGIILAMAIYSYVLLMVMSRFIERNMTIFKLLNAVLGLCSMLVGVWWSWGAVATIFAFSQSMP